MGEEKEKERGILWEQGLLQEEEKISDSRLDFFLKTIETLQKERDEYYDLLLRKQAEFENYRKRVVKEKEEQRLEAQAEVIRELLSILDALEKGLESLQEQSGEAGLEAYREGYELMLKEFRSVLDKFGVREVPGTGAQFDPNIHEAVISEVTTEHEEGRVLEEYRKGYEIEGRLVRPAQVRVAVRPDELSVGQGPADSGKEQN